MAARSKTPLCQTCRTTWRRGLDLIAKSLRKQAGNQHEAALCLEAGDKDERLHAQERLTAAAGVQPVLLLSLALELEGRCIDCARREAQRLAAQDRAAFVENRSRGLAPQIPSLLRWHEALREAALVPEIHLCWYVEDDYLTKHPEENERVSGLVLAPALGWVRLKDLPVVEDGLQWRPAPAEDPRWITSQLEPKTPAPLSCAAHCTKE